MRLEEAEEDDGQIRSGWLVADDGARFPVRDSVPRFVASGNYAGTFGLQWNLFRQTQLDSYSGHPISARRFWRSTGWQPAALKGQWVLDVGCGAGRFAEVALGAGAKVVAVDCSDAVDACYANLGRHPDLHVVQGDIYSLPLAASFFPFVYCLGVLQHTPDVAKAFAALPPMLCPGGRAAVDLYARSTLSGLHPRHLLRPVTRRMQKDRLLRLLRVMVPPLFRLSSLARRVPLAGRWLQRLMPVANHLGVLPLSQAQHLEWSLLDTFDWLSPRYDSPQTPERLHQWLVRAGLSQVTVERAGHLIGRGERTGG